MAESIDFFGRREYDHKGNYRFVVKPRTVADCVVFPAGASKIDDADVLDGDTTALTVLAPAGTEVHEGEECSIRGITFVVKHVPFDYAVGRRPVNRRHRPRVTITVERTEA